MTLSEFIATQIAPGDEAERFRAATQRAILRQVDEFTADMSAEEWQNCLRGFRMVEALAGPNGWPKE